MSSKKDIEALIRQAETIGWKYHGKGHSRHHRLSWPETGQKVFIAATPSDPHALRNAEADMARISGPLRLKPKQRKKLACQPNTSQTNHSPKETTDA